MMIQIFILTHNRPNTLIHSINSVLNQKKIECKYEIIISDNSTNNETQDIISKLYSDTSLEYVRRSPMSSIEHFNKILSEVTGDFFILFHDDDVMHPDMVANLFSAFKNDEELLAVGCNARLVRHNKIIGNFFKTKRDLFIDSVDKLLLNYLRPCHAPFPSYMYRKYVAQNISLDLKKGGKYCDVSFLLDIALKGKIKMLKQPLLNYCLHDGQDSAILDCTQQDLLVKYMVKVSSFNKKSSVIMQYRITNFYVKVCSFEKPFSVKRQSQVRALFMKYSPFYFFPRILIKQILKLI